jgi:hypothetical protein
MRTFYIRHSSKLDLDKDTLDHLWGNNLIAIHYPSFRDDELIDIDIPDNDSLDPRDYMGTGKTSMNILTELSRDGKYVFASYGHQGDCKVGEVKPGSPLRVHYGKWGEKWGYSGRVAAIKYLELVNVKQLTPKESINFKAVHPRQGTAVHWNAIGQKVKYSVTGEKPKKNVEYLSPTELEVMCSEYLRSAVCSKGINRIQSLQLPVGRTLVDVDIVGNDKDGNRVIAQVTNGKEKSKVNKLAKYLNQVNNDAQAIMIWNGESLQDQNIITLSPAEVFDAWCLGTEEGKVWLENVV